MAGTAGHDAIMAKLASTVATAMLVGSPSWPGSTLTGLLGVVAAGAFAAAWIVYPDSASSLGVGLGSGLLAIAVVAGVGLLAPPRSRRLGLEAEPARRQAA